MLSTSCPALLLDVIQARDLWIITFSTFRSFFPLNSQPALFTEWGQKNLSKYQMGIICFQEPWVGHFFVWLKYQENVPPPVHTNSLSWVTLFCNYRLKAKFLATTSLLWVQTPAHFIVSCMPLHFKKMGKESFQSLFWKPISGQRDMLACQKHKALTESISPWNTNAKIWSLASSKHTRNVAGSI